MPTGYLDHGDLGLSRVVAVMALTSEERISKFKDILD
jgi:hypothetical protein